MEKIIKKIAKDSIKLRNWSTLSNYSTSQKQANCLQDTFVCKTVENCKENVKKQNSSNLNDLDFDPKNFIKNVQRNYKNMDIKGVIEVMNILQKTFKEKKELSHIDLKNSEEFVHICKLILTNVRSLHMQDVIHILRILLFFNVPTNSMLIQTLLQLIRVSVNELSIGQIMTVYYTLSTLEKLPLIKALLIALPYAFKQQAELELNTESNNLLKALKFSCIVNDVKTKTRIINILLKDEQNIKLEKIVDIFYALYTLPKLNKSSAILLHKVTNKIITNCQSLTFNEIEQLLYYISTKVANGGVQFYNEELVDALCNTILNDSVTFHQHMIILKHLNKMRYSNISLLNFLATKCLLEHCTLFDIYHFIDGLIIADYKPPCWETMQAILPNVAIKYIRNYTIDIITSVAFRLLSLDCYCPELLEKVFTLYKIKHFKIISEETIMTLLKLHWYIKLLYPKYNAVMLEEDILNQINIEYKNDDVLSVMESLKEAAGGAEYIKRGLRTKFGEFVDYVVIIQPNGTLMNINDYNVDITFVEELTSLSECSKILFLVMPKEAYSFNKQTMLSTVKMQFKAMETLKGFYTYAINPYLWQNFSYDKKVLYLQEAIKLKCNDMQVF